LSRTALIAVLSTAVLSVGGVAPAHAGSYTVRACGSDGVNRAFWAYANGGMTAYARCPGVDYEGQSTGLVTGAVRNAGGGRLGLHASAWQIFEAPEGAALQSMTFRQSSGRSSGCWAFGIWGWTGDFHPGEHLWGYPANCGVGASGFSYFVGPYSLDLRGHRNVRLGVRCDAHGGCTTGGSASTWMSLEDVEVTVRDDSAPSISPSGGELLSDGWHRGSEWAWAVYRDNVGIRHIYGQVDGANTFFFHDFADPSWPSYLVCDYARPRPCSDVPNGGVRLETATIPDGAHVLSLVSVDAAGNRAAADHAIRIDNHAPAAPREAATEGGEGWRAANGFGVGWRNPPGQVAPIARAHWRMCRAAGTPDCRTGVEAGTGLERLAALRAPEAGDWTVAVWLEDEAGNVDGAHAADPVHLRLDDVAPETPGFDLVDPADPRRIAIPAGDRHSGLASARIELRQRGRGDWRPLPTSMEPDGRAVARVPDTELPDGAYDLRALLRDHAGNETLVATDRTGRAASLLLPLRLGTRFVARHSAALRCRTVLRRAGRRTVSRHVCRPSESAPEAAAPREPLRIPFGSAATLTGVLETAQGRPVVDALVEVAERVRTAIDWRSLPSLRTDASGRFELQVPAGPSRFLRVQYGGDDVLLPARVEARVLVPAASTLRAGPRRARNGGRVMFSGRLLGGPIPPGGRTLDLQAFYRGAWRTFATPRTDDHGRWRHPYRFGATDGRVVYRFRGLIKQEAAYPYEQGATPTVAVTVTGYCCPEPR
jgi:hypothetical protein